MYPISYHTPLFKVVVRVIVCNNLISNFLELKMSSKGTAANLVSTDKSWKLYSLDHVGTRPTLLEFRTHPQLVLYTFCYWVLV